MFFLKLLTVHIRRLWLVFETFYGDAITNKRLLNIDQNR